MYQIPGDFLMTYDPAYTEEHSDTSDFDETCSPLITKKGGNHSLIKRPHKKPQNYIPDYFNYDYPVKCKKRGKNEKAVQVDKRRKKQMYQNSGDQPRPVPSKLSIIRQRVIPCLSNMFRKPAKYGNMSTIAENPKKPRDHSCQHCDSYEPRRIKKLYRRPNYAVQPVYAIEGNVHKPVLFTPKINEPLYNKKFRNKYSSCSISSSSSSETQMKKMKAKSLLMKKRFKVEVMKEHWKYQQKLLKNQQHQYPSKDHKSSYQVFTSPYQQSRTTVSPSGSQYTSDMPASTSGFWDYLFDKINRKYQVQKMELPKPCNCSSSDQLACSPSNCENYEQKAESNYNKHQSSVGYSCSCAPKLELPTSGCCQKKGPSESVPPFVPSPLTSRNSLSLKIKPAGNQPAANQTEKNVQCKCYDKSDARSKAPSRATKLPSTSMNSKPCQEGHDDITTALADKYNGEILCIHNPPCILINGCLNLPPQKDSPQTNFWPVSESRKSAFNYKRKWKNSAKCEQACQYHVPYVEVRQCQTPEFRTEKKIQSICHHNPPCEVVRGCYKPKYDPTLQNSCIHVPMCQKIPKCVIGQRDRSCEHRPRCPEIPVCSRNYTVLTARENFGAQVKPKPLICRHMPPCIMIPKCLGRAMCEYIPYDAIPGCIHQPACELIPACCRKCKEMVSASSQYPNSCRIV